MFEPQGRVHGPLYFHREVVTLTLLTGLAAVLFIGVTALSQLYHAQQGALADRWAARGTSDLNAGRFMQAAGDFRTALRYSRDSYSSELGLAEALIGEKRIPEAETYLIALWEQQPENGVVNRSLARIAAGKGDTRNALRYYHNAIYAHWTGDPERERRSTRWELIKYLLSTKATAPAQSELISLAAEVGDDPAQQVEMGRYFLKVQDGDHALTAFRLRLQGSPHDAEALAGAGTAAFEMGNYELAEGYLRSAINEAPGDRDSAALLETTEQVLRLDPFRRQISDAERDQAVEGAFEVAGGRLKSCLAAANSQQTAEAPETLEQAWDKLKPQVTDRSLRRNQDIVNQSMNLAFAIEREAGTRCGAGTPADAALLLISKLHEGS
ncbi:MAG TPA: tetratricopeptide repeat protein [Terracidiphilus sp.]|nr:tetratricopeptide repeat protein [Terracidiphilus sp.]